MQGMVPYCHCTQAGLCVLRFREQAATESISLVRDTVRKKSEIKELLQKLKNCSAKVDAIAYLESILDKAKQVYQHERYDTIARTRALVLIGSALLYQRIVYCGTHLAKLYKKSGEETKHLQAVESTAEAYYESRQYDKAIEWYRKMLELSTAAGQIDGAIIALIQLGNAFDYLGKHGDALKQFRKSLSLADLMKSPSMQSKALEALYAFYIVHTNSAGNGKEELQVIEKRLIDLEERCSVPAAKRPGELIGHGDEILGLDEDEDDLPCDMDTVPLLPECREMMTVEADVGLAAGVTLGGQSGVLSDLGVGSKRVGLGCGDEDDRASLDGLTEIDTGEAGAVPEDLCQPSTAENGVLGSVGNAYPSIAVHVDSTVKSLEEEIQDSSKSGADSPARHLWAGGRINLANGRLSGDQTGVLVGLLPLPWRPFKEAERVYYFSRSTSAENIPVGTVQGASFTSDFSLRYAIGIGDEEEVVDGSCLKCLESAGESNTLSLSLDCNELDDASMRNLGPAIAAARDSCFSRGDRHLPSLDLSLQENVVTEHTCHLLSKCSVARYPFAQCILTRLCLSWNPIGDAGMEALSPILHHLKHLEVEGCCLADPSVDVLLRASPSRWALERLLLGYNDSIQEASLARLLTIGCGIKELKELGLAGNQIREIGGACAATLVCHHTSLQSLCLSRTPLGTGGVRAFCDSMLARELESAMSDLTNLRYHSRPLSLDFSWCSIEEDAVCHLVKTLICGRADVRCQGGRTWKLAALNLQACVNAKPGLRSGNTGELMVTTLEQIAQTSTELPPIDLRHNLLSASQQARTQLLGMAS
eukprot:scaffold695_cov384-Prasinococcus_capsulatus_cf.AAC.5